MYKIKENIIEAGKNSSVQIVELDSQKSDEIRKKISQLYCRKKDKIDLLIYCKVLDFILSESY